MDSEREKFRTYVEKSGVMSALTDVLVHLYEEPQRPPDALQYVKNSLAAHLAEDVTIRCSMLDEKVKEQEDTIESLKVRVQELEAELAATRPTQPTPQSQPPPPPPTTATDPTHAS